MIVALLLVAALAVLYGVSYLLLYAWVLFCLWVAPSKKPQRERNR